MPLIKPIKASLSGGYYSQAIYARVDIEKYASGLKRCKNTIVHSSGGVANRPGFMYRADCGVDTLPSRVVPFVFSSTQAYIIEFGHEFIRFFTPNGQVANAGVPYEVTSPYDSSAVSSLNIESSADVIYITHPDYRTRTLTRFGNVNWVLDEYDPDDGPFQSENIDEGSSLSLAAVTGTTTLSLATTLDPYTVLQLSCDGADASTTFTDDTGTHTGTAVGTAQLDTDFFVYGTASGLFDGNSDYVTFPDSADWNFGTGDFTISFNFRADALSTTVMGICGQHVDTNTWWQVYVTSTVVGVSLVVGMTNASSKAGGLSLVADEWYHVEIVRTGTTMKVFIDGVDMTTSDGIQGADFTDMASVLYYGSGKQDISTFTYFHGRIDEFRISKGIARHIEDFTPPTKAYDINLGLLGDFRFDPLMVGNLFKLRHYIEGQAVTVAFTSATTSSSIKCFTTWRLITHGTWAGTLRIEKSSDGGTTWTNLREFSSVNDFNANTSGTEDIETNTEPFLVRLNMTAYTSGTCNANLTTDAFYQNGVVRTTGYIDEASMTVSVVTDAGLTTSTLLWSEGSWSDYRGYPAVARFYKDRLCFASTYKEPMAIWMSVLSNYNSFFRHSTLLDTDGITTNLPSRQLNAITGLVPLNKLIAFTSSSEWAIGAGTDGILTPSSITQDVQGYRGSHGVDPVTVGNETIFVQKTGKVIRSLGYEFASDSFNGSELNVLAKDLFEYYTIEEMAYQQDPDSIVWCRRSDGNLLGLTYLREQEVVAWHEHDTQGTFESIAVIPTTGYDQLWACVGRNGKYYIESMKQRMVSRQLKDQFFLDSGLTYDSASTSTITGLGHLEGRYVNILADGTVLDSQLVSSATLSLATEASVVHAGLGYCSDVELLNLDASDRLSTLQGKRVQIAQVIFRLINTRGGQVGTNEDNLYDYFRKEDFEAYSEQSLDADALYSGDLRVGLQGGYGDGGRVFFRQEDPLPFEITAIILEASIGDTTG